MAKGMQNVKDLDYEEHLCKDHQSTREHSTNEQVKKNTNENTQNQTIYTALMTLKQEILFMMIQTMRMKKSQVRIV